MDAKESVGINSIKTMNSFSESPSLHAQLCGVARIFIVTFQFIQKFTVLMKDFIVENHLLKNLVSNKKIHTNRLKDRNSFINILSIKS